MIVTEVREPKQKFSIRNLFRRKKNTFDWNKSQEEINYYTKTKRSPNRPVNQDWTETLVINHELTKGLYHNNYPGFKLAGGLAYPIISVPVSFMGFPIAKTETEDDDTDKRLAKITERLTMEMKKIHIQCHRDGTCWVYPKFDSETMDVVLEFIPDCTITDIVKDPNTKKVIAIYTDERIKLRTGYNSTATARKIRVFTKSVVQVMYKEINGSLNGIVKDKTMRNPIGILPIPFANNADGDEIRGYSDYERILSNLKNYHDTRLSEGTALNKFKPKWIQGCNDNVGTWLEQNGIDDIDDMDIAETDVVFNIEGKESTALEFPERMVDGYEKSLETDFRLICEGSGLPEIIFGVKTKGNANTAEEQMTTFVLYVKDKRRAKVRSYEILFMAVLRLLQMTEPANNYQADNIIVFWDDLDSMSDKVKSEVFKNFAEGMSKLYGSAGFTKKQALKLWKIYYPNATEEDLNDFIIGLEEMGAFKRAVSSSVMEFEEYKGFDANGNPSS